MVNEFKAIIADENGKELGYVDESYGIDVEVGGSDDFEITINTSQYDKEKFWYNHRFFIPGTEYGGILDVMSLNAESDKATWNGFTWRGLLGKKIVEPPEGEAYLILSGDLNEILSDLFEGKFGELYRVSNLPTGVEIENYQFERYVTLTDAITDLLEGQNYRLNLEYKQGEGAESGYIEVSAKPIVDYSNELEYSTESKCKFDVTDDRGGINHLICLGQGELEERTVLHLYVQENGEVAPVQHYFGKDERSDIYDYANIESEDELYESGVAKLKELQNFKKVSISIDDIDLELGDIVGGYEPVTDTQVRKPIIKKILRVSGGIPEIEYEIKGDD